MLKRFIGIILLAILWYSFSWYVGVKYVPYPHDVIKAFIELYPKELNVHVFASLKRLLIGLLIAIFLGVHIGMILGLSKIGDQLISPLIQAVYPVPKAALLPILIILYGTGDFTKILLIVIIVIFPIIINIKNAIGLIPKENFYVVKTLKLTKWQLYKDIVIPAIMPSLLTSIRIGIGTSIAVLYLSESFASTNGGLGYYIGLVISYDNLQMFAAFFALSLIGAILFLLVDVLERHLCRWM